MNTCDTIGQVIVVKVGGNEIDDDSFLAELVAAVKAISEQSNVVVVHGGGKEIADLHGRLGVPFDFVEGLRVTSFDSLRLVKMVLSGAVNTRVTRWLVNGGVNALGLSGVDLGLIRVQPLRPRGVDIGYVGKVVEVRVEKLWALLDAGIVPVVSPLSLGVDGQSYNVNADQVAAALAASLEAEQLVFVSNVPGVMLDSWDSMPVSELTAQQVEGHVAEGRINGGMVPKVRSASEAVMNGVHQAVITDIAGLRSGRGTAVVVG
ncbi:MAG: acetylglutamate kinase [Chloroflexota bacterium]|nr:acetylglutamate kinase [Chloroflexota bacterium]